jgi:hypothetical protein
MLILLGFDEHRAVPVCIHSKVSVDATTRLQQYNVTGYINNKNKKGAFNGMFSSPKDIHFSGRLRGR